jgi:hypothetical protein
VAQRAVIMPERLAIEPPVVSTPPAAGGSANNSASHRRMSASMATRPGAANATPVYRFNTLETRSAIAAASSPLPGTNAK